MKLNNITPWFPSIHRRELTVGLYSVGNVVQSHVVVKIPGDFTFKHNLCGKGKHKTEKTVA